MTASSTPTDDCQTVDSNFVLGHSETIHLCSASNSDVTLDLVQLLPLTETPLGFGVWVSVVMASNHQ